MVVGELNKFEIIFLDRLIFYFDEILVVIGLNYRGYLYELFRDVEVIFFYLDRCVFGKVIYFLVFFDDFICNLELFVCLIC